MGVEKVSITTDTFTKQEIRVIEETLREWNYEWIVEIIYVAENTSDKPQVTFIVDKDNLGEFLSFIFAAGYEFVYRQ